LKTLKVTTDPVHPVECRVEFTSHNLRHKTWSISDYILEHRATPSATGVECRA